jgi:hypothetical protein
VWKQLFHALWKTFETDFGAILRNMHEHMVLIQSQATITQYTEVLRSREAAELALESQKEAELHRRREVVRQWLSAANCEADQETFANIRHAYPGTGHWLLTNNHFTTWFDPMYCLSHMLWINGIPGALV